MTYWIDGTLSNYLYFEKLYKIDNNIKLILIQRDPIDILASIKIRKATTDATRYKNKTYLSFKMLEKKFSLFLNTLSIKKLFKYRIN
jgi:hypothetical protein